MIFQYYLDLGDNFARGDDLDGAVGENGYLSMNSVSLDEPSDYTKMSMAPPPPEEDFMSDKEKLIVDMDSASSRPQDEERYVNFDLTTKNARLRNKGKGSGEEKLPLIDMVNESQLRDSPGRKRSKANGTSPTRLSTQADVHRNEDSDSGHESFAPGSSPDKMDENDGYLSPKSVSVQNVPVFELNGVAGKPKNTGNGHARLIGSKYIYEDLPPPDYRAVMEANETNV